MTETRRSLLALALTATLPLAACASHPSGPYVELKGHDYSIEIAEDDASRAHGLMDRESMPADHGMLFVFPEEAPRAFWMKNTKIPLDMIFLDKDGEMISVQHDVPPCTGDPCPSYSSGAPAKYVLELNAGEARKIGLLSGDKMTIHR